MTRLPPPDPCADEGCPTPERREGEPRSAAPRASRPTLELLAGRLVGFACTFFVPIVLVRLLEPGDFGTYKQLFLVFATVYGLAQGGMAESLFYFLPKDPRRGGSYVVNALLMLALWGSGTALVLWLLRRPLAALLNNDAIVPHLPLLLLYVLFTVGSAGLEIVLTCQGRYRTAAAAYALSDATRAFALVAPVALGAHIHGLMVGAVLHAAVRFTIGLAMLATPFAGSLRPDRALLAEQLGYALPFQAAVLVEVVHANLHQYAVAWWYGATLFAVYAVGCLQMPLMELAASSAGNVLMVGMGRARSAGDPAAAHAVWLDTTRKLAVALFPLVGLLVVTAGHVIPFLFTDAYLASTPVFVIWTLGALLSVVQTDAALRAHAEVRFLLAANVVRAAAVALLMVPAIALAGLAGAAAAHVAAAAIFKGLCLGRLARIHRIRVADTIPWRTVLPLAAACAAAGLPALAVGRGFVPGTLLALAATSTAYAAALAPLFVGLRFLESERAARLPDAEAPEVTSCAP